MNALAINFVQGRRLASPLGLLLLVVGMAAAGVVALDYQDARDALGRVELRQARVSRPASATRPNAGTSTADSARNGANGASGAKAIEVLADQLSLPWDAMLRAIETRSDPAVALLSVEAQGQTRTIRISGEAKSMSDVAAYVRHLRESPLLASVFLNGHEEKQAGAVTVIRFALDAKWSGPL